MKKNILEYFKHTALNFSNKVAIDDNDSVMSFSELDTVSNHIGFYLISKVNTLRKPIAVFLPKNRWSVAAFIGIVKSGNFYVPLDLTSPHERIFKILKTLETSCVVTNSELKENLIKIGYEGIIICVEDAIQVGESTESNSKLDLILKTIIDLDPIYSIFTSGSTGMPKGVLISQRGVIDFIKWAIETYKLSDKEIIGNQVPFYFDMSVLDIYMMIFTGATLHIIPQDRFSFPLQLIEYLNTKKINFVFWVPSVLNNVSNFAVFSVLKPTSLSKILFAGEPMPNKHLNYWRNNYNDALYSNLYGPTEVTVIATYYVVDRPFNDNESLPIGKACSNTQTLILSENGEIVEKGEIGELTIRGSLLALGYYNNKLKTAESFIQNPLHNTYPDIVYKTGDLVYENHLEEIIFVGRKDSQIKHLGYRIELGEIETAILGIPDVANACILYDNDSKKIVAFIISKKKTAEIRKELTPILPKYMIPTKWINVPKLPLNANGKIDRLELTNLF